jgi:hypothetical protein
MYMVCLSGGGGLTTDVDRVGVADTILWQPGECVPDGRCQLFPLDVEPDTRQRRHVYWYVLAQCSRRGGLD